MADPKGTIITDLLTVMDKVRVIRKDSLNKSQNFNFRGVDATLNAVGPEFREVGIVPTSRILNVEHRDIQTTKGAVQRETILTVEYTFTAKDGSSATTEVVAESADSGDKSAPKAMSVALRTALLQILCMPTDDADPDEHVVERGESGPDADDVARERGWKDDADLQATWAQLRTETTEDMVDIRDWVKAQKFTLGTFTVDQAQAWDELISNHIQHNTEATSE